MTDVHICLVRVTLSELEFEFDVVMSGPNRAKVLKLCAFECGWSYRLSGLEVSDSCIGHRHNATFFLPSSCVSYVLAVNLIC
jgi:hypothetical protein